MHCRLIIWLLDLTWQKWFFLRRGAQPLLHTPPLSAPTASCHSYWTPKYATDPVIHCRCFGSLRVRSHVCCAAREPSRCISMDPFTPAHHGVCVNAPLGYHCAWTELLNILWICWRKISVLQFDVVSCCSAFNQRDKMFMVDYKPRQRNNCGVCLRYFVAVANIVFLVSLLNPLECKGNSATSDNMKLVHWPLVGGLLHFGTARRGWACDWD